MTQETMRFRRLLLFRYLGWLVPLFAVASLHAQTAAPKSGSPPVIQTNVRVVLVDVVAILGKDQPIPSLHKEDFQVFENGQPQAILYFAEHQRAAPTQVKLPPMPPGVFTNFPTIKTSDAVNVLLLDWLNTQPQDQPYVRAQVTKYLQNVQAGSSLAIFALGSRLHMVQGFSADPSRLLAALEDGKSGAATRASPLLGTALGNAADQEMIDLMAMNDAAPAAIEAAKQEMTESAAHHTDDRIRITLQALQQLARYLSGIQGRKNLIWFSGSFPISIFPGSGVAPRKYQQDLRRTADLLTPSEVAIYPVSAAGLTGDANYDASYNRGPTIREGNAQRTADQAAMDELAKDTGGQSFYNTNGLTEAVSQVIDNGTRYYTLAYTPTDKRMDGTYRSIGVKLAAGKYRLAYRRGYYAEDARSEQTAGNPVIDPLLPLMLLGLPDFAQILYKVRVLVLPPQPATDPTINNPDRKAPITRYGVDFAIAAEDVKLEAAPDGVRHGNIEAMLVAYDRNGKAVSFAGGKSEILLRPEEYERLRRVGLQLHREIDVPQGDVYLRTGFFDLNSGKAGTLGIPLSGLTAPATTKK